MIVLQLFEHVRRGFVTKRHKEWNQIRHDDDDDDDDKKMKSCGLVLRGAMSWNLRELHELPYRTYE